MCWPSGEKFTDHTWSPSKFWFICWRHSPVSLLTISTLFQYLSIDIWSTTVAMLRESGEKQNVLRFLSVSKHSPLLESHTEKSLSVSWSKSAMSAAMRRPSGENEAKVTSSIPRGERSAPKRQHAFTLGVPDL